MRVLALAAAALAAGCLGAVAEPPLELVFQDERHAVLSIRNQGARAVDADAMLATTLAWGPSGGVVLVWADVDGRAPVCVAGGTAEAPVRAFGVDRCDGDDLDRMPMRGKMLAPGESVAFRFHALEHANGTILLVTPDASRTAEEMPMHLAGSHVGMPRGDYTFVVGGHPLQATLR